MTMKMTMTTFTILACLSSCSARITNFNIVSNEDAMRNTFVCDVSYFVYYLCFVNNYTRAFRGVQKPFLTEKRDL